jgi:hypothetical protein
MQKRSEVLAAYAESLLFESTFGSAGSGNEVTKRAQLISVGGAAALSSENAETSGDQVAHRSSGVAGTLIND